MSAQAPAFPIVGIHLDCKYLAVNKRYLIDQWLDELAGFGINTILLEYEDKFPYQKYPFIVAEGAFTPQELRAFLKKAHSLKIGVIPLVQTLSHLEFALDHEQLAAFREMPDVPTQICPSNPAAVQFVKDLIEEVLAYHKDDPYFHLGADETWHLGTCPQCKPRVDKIGKTGLWCEHENELIKWIKSKGKRPIVWDDIFWSSPQDVVKSGLPKDVILTAWDYNVTSYAPKAVPVGAGASGGSGAADEYGSTKKQPMSQVDVYHHNGYQTLAAPCYNWGVLVPRHEHCLRNTEAWAHKARASHMLGVLNTSWACFHTPLQVQQLHLAATADLFGRGRDHIDEAWQHSYLSAFFGPAGSAPELPQALRDASINWEFKVEGLGRPITLLPYGYMNLVMHFPGGQPERRRRGVYPVDWNEVDFPGLFRRQLDFLRKDPATVTAKLDEFEPGFERASKTLHVLAAKATKHKPEAELYATFADLRLACARVLRQQVLGKGDATRIAADLKALKPALERTLAQAYEPVGVKWAMKIWWEPQAKLYGV